MGLSPAESGLAQTVGLVPWNMTPLLGIITDLFPILGYHRKAYRLIVGLLGECGLASASNNLTNY